jgi:nucleoside-diphosphate-sugar epimerase
LIVRVRASRVVVPGDGGNYLSPAHVAVMAAAVATALNSAPAGSTFNVVDEPLRYGDYVDRRADRLGAPRPPRDPARPRPPAHRCTNRAAREVLGWEPNHSIWPA